MRLAHFGQTQANRKPTNKIAGPAVHRDWMEFENLRAAAQRGRYLLLGVVAAATVLIIVTNQIF